MRLLSRSITILSLSIIMIGCFSQIKSQEPDKTNYLKADKLKEDLTTLKFWITEAHGDPYRFTTKEKLDKLFAEAAAKINNAGQMTEYEFLGTILPIVVEIRDGHGQIFPSNLDKIEGEVILPFKLRFINKEPYILENYTDLPIERGEMITSINDVEAKAFFRSILPLVHRDGNVESIRYRRLENPLYLARLMKAMGLLKETFRIGLQSKDQTKDQTKELIIRPITQAQYFEVKKTVAKRLVNPLELSFKVDDEGNQIPVLSIKSFNPHFFQDSYHNFKYRLDSLMKEVNTVSSTKLILDLRNNYGGEDSYALYLLRYLMKESFAYNGEVTFRKNDYKFLPDGKHWDIDSRSFKKNDKGTYDATDFLWPNGPSTIGDFEPLPNNYKGKLVVLVNAYTFSAATEVAAILHHSNRATFLGVETGGSYIGCVAGYTPTLNLPNSRLKYNLSLISIKRPFFESDFTDRGVIPDITVEPQIEDLLTGSDPVLVQALRSFDR